MFNKIVLGSAQFGIDYGINRFGEINQDKVHEILDSAYSNGIKLIDTAESYGNAIQIIGDFIKHYPKKNFNIISKIKVNDVLKLDNLKYHIEKNLEILNKNYLYGYMFHSYKDFMNNKHLYEELKKIQQEGLIKKIGISLYENHQIEDIINNYNYDLIQVPFSLIDNETRKKNLLRKAKSKSIEVHARSLFLQGLFFNNMKSENEIIKPLYNYINKLKDICENNGSNIETIALHYPLKMNFIDKVVIGVHDIKQLKKNINSIKLNIKVPNSEIEKINVIEKELLKPYNWIKQ